MTSAMGRSVRTYVIFVLLPLALFGCQKGNREEREVAKLSREILDFYLASNAVEASGAGDHRLDGKLDTVDREWMDRYLAKCREFRDRLSAIDRGKLTRRSSVEADVLMEKMDRQIQFWGESASHERDPLIYTQIMWNSIFFLISRDYAPLEKRINSVASRLEQFPRFVSEARENLDNPPKVMTELAIQEIDGVESLLRNDLAVAAAPLEGKNKRFDRALSTALAAVGDFREFLKKDLVNRSFGDARIGEQRYRREFALVGGTNERPEDMVAAAYDDLGLLQLRIYEEAARVYEEATGSKPPSDADEKGRRAIIDRAFEEIEKDHVTPPELLDACRNAYTEEESFVREHDLVTLPPERPEILWAPELVWLSQVAASHASGPLDANQQYFFVVHRIDSCVAPEDAERQLRIYNNSAVRIVTIHEAMPGHLVQFYYANRYAPRTNAMFDNRFTLEGWSVYCEGMMAEEGFRAADAKMRLALARLQLRYAVNAIVDAGFHFQNMQESQAVKFMVEEGYQTEDDAILKWRVRVPAYPVGYSGYYVGLREMRRMRDDARERWGADYTPKRFHESVLRSGPISIRFIRRLLELDS